jgi:hypothetical protein
MRISPCIDKEGYWQGVSKSFSAVMDKSREIDRGFGRYAEKLSRYIWPWRELWLLAVVGVLISLDYASTYAMLELNRNKDIYESGPLAAWALQMGGFYYLLLIDIVAASILSLLALIVRYFYTKHGYTGYARAAFVIVLAPYIIFTIGAVINNIILQFF